MPSAKSAVLAGLAALALSACGVAAKPLAGTIHATAPATNRGRVDDPRTTKTNYVTCLTQHHLPVAKVGATGLQVGSLPGGPTIDFAPTPGAAEARSIEGQAQGAEVISSALLYTNAGSDEELKQIEDCLVKGISG
ncbi:MAG: hypothetical protein ACR2IP_04200 [Solirubrobacteraceae bacterium]